jgi:DNA segregation ATPase FtsK/SpoIIIE, S-DNA-T family
MAVTLTVSEIRQALVQAGAESAEGAPSTALLGQIFHRCLSDLLRFDSEVRLETIVRPLDANVSEWKDVLKRTVYDRSFGPAITGHVSALQCQGEQVLSLWMAIQESCDLLADLWWEINGQGTLDRNQADWFFAEQPIVREFQTPGWSEPVVLLGQADAILKVPGKDRWCILEWKLGRTTPAADVAQACLYRMILDRTPGVLQSAVAVIGFHPERTERVFEAAELAASEGALLELIGKLAERKKRPVQPPPLPIGSTTKRTGSGSSDGSTPPTSVPAVEAVVTSWIANTRDAMLNVLRKAGTPCKESKPAVVGPTLVRFFVVPVPLLSIKKIKAQGEQLKLHLSLKETPSIRLGDEGAFEIDLTRPDRQSIPFSLLRTQLPVVRTHEGCSQVPLGIDMNGRWQWTDLSKSESPHLLVVGTSGSGKSQWLRTAVASLISTNTPETLKLMLIDPKQNAFQFARSSPFLKCPIVVPAKVDSVSVILEDLLSLLQQRASLFADANCQDLAAYVKQTGKPLPRVICVCDEFADLLLQSTRQERKDIERALNVIASIGRSNGVHLILATQQPRRDVLTSAIRSNIGSRIVLRVSTPLESRLALEENGAEQLLGNGDLYYKCIGAPLRLQGAWLPSNEEALVLEEREAGWVQSNFEPALS